MDMILHRGYTEWQKTANSCERNLMRNFVEKFTESFQNLSLNSIISTYLKYLSLVMNNVVIYR